MTLFAQRAGAALAAAALLGPVAATPASAETPSGDCAGVWVAVEGQATRCATRHATGQEALTSAGFTVEDGSPGMLCRIGGVPDVCKISPSGYWSYWQSTRGPDGTWTPWSYSQLGYTVSHPVAGSAEGWIFGDGRTPPAALPAFLTTSPGSAAPNPGASHGPGVPTAAPAPVPGPGDLTGVVVAGALLLIGGTAVAVTLARRRRG